MTIFFGEFITMLSKTPSLQMITLLTLGVMLVNGWTDAPNAIASLVASGGMELKKAVRMARGIITKSAFFPSIIVLTLSLQSMQKIQDISLVASGGMELKKAVRMAAFFNFAGLALMTACNSTVAFTIYHIADFGDSPQRALMALCAATVFMIRSPPIAVPDAITMLHNIVIQKGI